MKRMFDLHCDTLTRDAYPARGRTPDRGTLDDPVFHLALSKMPPGAAWVQCFAVFVPDSLRGQDAVDFFDRHAASFQRQMEQNRDRVRACRTGADLSEALELSLIHI